MDLTRLFVCSAIVLVLMTDVVCSRSVHDRQSTELDAVVRDIDERLIRSERRNSRRRRRHLQTQQLALMEFCLKFPHRCRQEMENLRRQENERNIRVIVIQK